VRRSRSGAAAVLEDEGACTDGMCVCKGGMRRSDGDRNKASWRGEGVMERVLGR
jgi:hypothetical protein